MRRVMRTNRLVPLLGLIMLAMTVASVSASGYSVGVPILGTTGAPALSGSQYTGILNVLYADGMPVVLASNKVVLQLCRSMMQCVNQVVTLKQTAPGTYSYSFAPPSGLAGTITIDVVAGSLADDNGRVFPSVDTQIGTYATPGLSSSGTAAPPTAQALPANPVPQSNQVVGQAVALPQPTHASPIAMIVLSVTLVLVAAGGLLILPRRH